MNKSLVIGCFAVIGMGFLSCSKDLYDSNAVNEKQNEKQKNDYATNFVKRYGEIDPNQTWDFATMTPIRTWPAFNQYTCCGRWWSNLRFSHSAKFWYDAYRERSY